MSTAVAASQKSITPPNTDAAELVGIIERAARDPNVDIDKLERLLSLRQRIADGVAERNFNAALNACQAAVGRIAADATNPQTGSQYATYAKLDKILRPIYTSNGFSLSFDEADSPKPEHVRVVCHLSHKDGHTRTYHRDMPSDGKGAKGGDVMTKTHASGAAQSYGMRYLVKGIFNIAIGDDDNDGNETPSGERITENQVADLVGVLTEVGASKASLLKYLKINALEDIPAANYEAVVRIARSYRPPTK